MNKNTNDLRTIMIKFAESGWDLIDAPASACVNLMHYIKERLNLKNFCNK